MAQSGRFVWYELESADADAASKFYTELLGWSLQELPMGDFSYRMIVNQGTPIGGFGSLRDASLAPRWTSWCYVPDLEAADTRAKSLGAKLLVEPTAIPPGRFSVIRDPQGAELTLFQHDDAPDAKPEGTPPHGTFGWNELHTTDAAAGARFYRDLLGYQLAEVPMGGPEPYRILRIGERDEAGAMRSPSGACYWLPYVSVDDVDARHGRVAALGGRSLKPPEDIPQVGRFAIVADPTGGTLAIMTWAG